MVDDQQLRVPLLQLHPGDHLELLAALGLLHRHHHRLFFERSLSREDFCSSRYERFSDILWQPSFVSAPSSCPSPQMFVSSTSSLSAPIRVRSGRTASRHETTLASDNLQNSRGTAVLARRLFRIRFLPLLAVQGYHRCGCFGRACLYEPCAAAVPDRGKIS